MAHIRMAHNDLEDKCREANQKYREALGKAIEKDQKSDMKWNIFFGVMGLGLILVLILVISRPEIPRNAQEWVKDFLKQSGMFLAASAIAPPDFVLNMSFIPRMLCGFAWGVFFAVVGMLMSFLAYLVGPIVRICMYVIPATGFYFLSAFFQKYRPRVEMLEISDVDVWSAKYEMDVIQAGLEGERAALDCLRDLDDDCYIFTNLHIPHEGKESETDMIVVTPSGITIVEVKNYKGIIRGHASDHDLIQIKDEEEEFDEHSFYNPIKQVATHAYRLAGYLRNNHLQTYVRTCVLFVNPESKLQIQGCRGEDLDKCPVFHVNQLERMHRYLHSDRTYLSDREFNCAVKLLEQLL